MFFVNSEFSELGDYRSSRGELVKSPYKSAAAASAATKKKTVAKKKSPSFSILDGAKKFNVLETNSVGKKKSTTNKSIAVSSFVFQWILPVSVSTFWGISSNKSYHAEFNRLFVDSFPKLLYVTPSTSYTDEGVFSSSSIHAVGETKLSPSATKEKIIQIAEQAGFSGSESKIDFSQQTAGQLQEGGQLQLPRNPVAVKLLAKSNKQVKKLKESGVGGIVAEEISKSLVGEDLDVFGYKIPKLYALMVGGIFVIIMLKK